ncbi:MAG: DUF2934 domain-containing protein [Nitrospirae bacterium]|nr:DUF2934 domain-containing protein [Nitrospirota bacterium]
MSYQDEVEKIAYELYEASGRISGRDLDNWIEAEHIVARKYAQKKSGNRQGKETTADCGKNVPQKRKQPAGDRMAVA